MKCTKKTMVRTVFLMLSLVNQVLTAMGKNPLPFSDEAIYEGLSAAATVIASLWAWWKNNSFTPAAVEADAYLQELKKGEET